MPKKTRREKIISKLRRELQAQQANSAITATPDLPSVNTDVNRKVNRDINPVITNRIKFQPKPANQNQYAATSYTVDHSHVVYDLKKIFFITALAILFEAILYLILNPNLLNKIGTIFH